MKQRSLENQYRMLDALKARFDAVEVPVRLSGWGRAQELAALATELAEGEVAAVIRQDPPRLNPSPSASPVVQTQLFEEAA